MHSSPATRATHRLLCISAILPYVVASGPISIVVSRYSLPCHDTISSLRLQSYPSSPASKRPRGGSLQPHSTPALRKSCGNCNDRVGRMGCRASPPPAHARRRIGLSSGASSARKVQFMLSTEWEACVTTAPRFRRPIEARYIPARPDRRDRDQPDRSADRAQSNSR